MNSYSDYIVYVDESGSPTVANSDLDNEYPIFVLACVVVQKNAYSEQITPSIQKLNFEFWGHDAVVLHEHDIRKRKNICNILLNEGVRERFFHTG